MNTVYERNYKTLIKLAPELWCLDAGEALKSRSEGFMDLNLDVLYKPQDDQMTIALSHYYKHPSGDMIPDPDMEIRVYRSHGFVETLTYQDSLVYQRVYLDENRYYPKLKKSLNSFLSQWLKNCLAQGHQLKRSSIAA